MSRTTTGLTIEDEVGDMLTVLDWGREDGVEIMATGSPGDGASRTVTVLVADEEDLVSLIDELSGVLTSWREGVE